jgi:hypothetical protein
LDHDLPNKRNAIWSSGYRILFSWILVPQYRYNIRLAGFYQSRSDLIVLFSGDLGALSFDQSSAAVTPTIDFGKTPRTPVDQLIELAKALQKIGETV